VSPARVTRSARRDVVSTRLSAERAQAIAETLHQGQRDPGGEPLIDHVQRVAAAVPRAARVVAWLHEVLEHTSISEHALLAAGLPREGLRALRLLTRHRDSRSDTIYLAHIEMIGRASGPCADIARTVKRADLTDRALNPPSRADGWSPPYQLGLQILRDAPPPDPHAPSGAMPLNAETATAEKEREHGAS
jgi:hypothetical protein